MFGGCFGGGCSCVQSFTALGLASFKGHLPVASALIAAGADVNAVDKVREWDEPGMRARVIGGGSNKGGVFLAQRGAVGVALKHPPARSRPACVMPLGAHDPTTDPAFIAAVALPPTHSLLSGVLVSLSACLIVCVRRDVWRLLWWWLLLTGRNLGAAWGIYSWTPACR